MPHLLHVPPMIELQVKAFHLLGVERKVLQITDKFDKKGETTLAEIKFVKGKIQDLEDKFENIKTSGIPM